MLLLPSPLFAPVSCLLKREELAAPIIPREMPDDRGMESEQQENCVAEHANRMAHRARDVDGTVSRPNTGVWHPSGPYR